MNDEITGTDEATAAAAPTKPKRASKKAKAKAKVAKPKGGNGRGFVYELTATGRKELAEAAGQQAHLFAYLKRQSKPVTTAEAAAAVEGAFKKDGLSQPAKRAVAFYMSQWKRAKYLKASKRA